MKTTSTYLTSEELALRWQVHKNSLSNWRSQGRGPRFIKIGKKVLYPLTEVEIFEEKGLRQSTAEYFGRPNT